MADSEHLSDRAIAEFVRPGLPTEREVIYHQHLRECAECRRRYCEASLARASRAADPAPDAGEPPPAPEPVGADDEDDASDEGEPPELPASFEDFRLLRPLPPGAWSRSFLAEDVLLERRVILKFIRRRSLTPRQLALFFQDLRPIVRGTFHPTLQLVFRAGHVDGWLYVGFEALEGLTLDEVPRPVPWRDVVGIGSAVASGLAEAHQHRLLHGDIKPSQVVVTKSGEVKLVGVGELAFLSRSADGASVGGTPSYMAPELWAGSSASVRTDLYALGAVLYELCAGHPPHRESAVSALRQAVQSGPAPPLRSVAPQLPPRLAAVIDRCLHKDPEARFATAAELQKALARCGSRWAWLF